MTYPTSDNTRKPPRSQYTSSPSIIVVRCCYSGWWWMMVISPFCQLWLWALSSRVLNVFTSIRTYAFTYPPHCVVLAIHSIANKCIYSTCVCTQRITSQQGQWVVRPIRNVRSTPCWSLPSMPRGKNWHVVSPDWSTWHHLPRVKCSLVQDV